MHVTIASTAALAGLILATTFADGQALQTTSIGKHNDFSCQPSANHPRPVVLLHGLGATYYDDLHVLEAFLQIRGFCTFSLTYGAVKGSPFLGGFAPIDESSRQIADFIYEVHAKTVGYSDGGGKIDIVGHSEGGFQALYVPKFRDGVAALVDHIVAIAPPTHGTPIANLLSLSPPLDHDAGLLEVIGCAACDQLSIGGASVVKLNDGKAIVQPGNKVTVIISNLDAIVIPPKSAFIYEDGVDNISVQDYCPLDIVGHISEPYDVNIWNLVLNSLENQVGRKFPCLVGVHIYKYIFTNVELRSAST
ncbi:lipase class 2 [Beauveria bassiana ARSEF 2860]|uniref:Lipase class 2 n=1 Tax=Beauveria bassiana (strain ARSEF 2860) TaxID=655819 RepID=J4KNK4_BEAB2|nr:lipase class 2 [Beauveria bassiana ARSEF 2860]EJP65859.1 lipase class 2 [Beauveria bassiana ARSEF 2860]